MAANYVIRKGEAVGLALARGGSKGLPGKNVRPLAGFPLVSWAIAAGLSARLVSRVIMSTDDLVIADVSRRSGAEVPFIRPPELAADDSTDIEVFTHALQWLQKHEGGIPEFFIQLRPTTPFRDPEWIDAALEKMALDSSITCTRTVAIAPHTPYKMWTLKENGSLSPLLHIEGEPESFNMPRQRLPKVYWHTGQLDIIRTATLLTGSMTGSNIHPIIVDSRSAVDIDHLIDFQLAEISFQEQMPISVQQRLSRLNQDFSASVR